MTSSTYKAPGHRVEQKDPQTLRSSPGGQPALHQVAPNVRFCTSCGDRLSTGESCRRCTPTAQRIDLQANGFPQAPASPFAWITATGRLRAAGLTIVGSAFALVLSMYLPWASALGIASARPSGAGIFAVLLLASGLALLSTRVLQNSTTGIVRTFLWILAGVDALVVLVLFAGLDASSALGGVVQPGPGFYVAMMALIGSIIGTIMQQTVKTEVRTENVVKPLR